jgi:hypothetical protein
VLPGPRHRSRLHVDQQRLRADELLNCPPSSYARSWSSSGSVGSAAADLPFSSPPATSTACRATTVNVVTTWTPLAG